MTGLIRAVLVTAAALVVLPSLASPGASEPAAAPPPSVAAADWQSDVDALDRILRALHPGLLRYQTEAEYAARVGVLRDAFPNGASLGDAYLALSGFTAALRCGHTYPNPLNQPASTIAALYRKRDRLPFLFRWIDRRMVVTRVLSARLPLRRGDVIVALDARPTPAILARLLAYARADGGNDAKRADLLELHGDARDEAFDILYPLAFGMHGTRFRVGVRAPFAGAPLRALDVPAMTGDERVAAIPSAKPPRDAPLFTFRLERGVGTLTMPTWAAFNSTWNWKRFVDDTFVRLASAHARTLIVDLRGNEGGLDVGDEIVAHLIAAPLRTSSYRRLVRYRRVPDELRPLLSTWDRSFYDWGDAAVPFDDRFLRLTRYDDDAAGTQIVPQAPRFAGRVFVLVDAANSSATFQFAQLVQRAHLATLVGTPTGGNRRGINGGAFFFATLPKSQIEIDVPLIGTFTDAPQPDAGIVPDFVIRTSAGDIARGSDPAAAFVGSR